MSVITKTGDQGTTWAGGRVSKASPNVEVLGELDELNCWIGKLVENGFPYMEEELTHIQDCLMRASAAFVKGGKWEGAKEEVAWLERKVYEYEAALPELQNFIYPQYPSDFHIARAVCRRVERRIVDYINKYGHYGPGAEAQGADIMVFVNRLSDYLFTAARVACSRSGRTEKIWVSRI